jgi:adenylate cyclase class 2
MTKSHTSVDAAPRCNLELKARLRCISEAAERAREVATETLGEQCQTDTYFHVRSGRLKLREIEGATAQLVSYSRPDQPHSKESHYRLVPVAEPTALKQALSDTLGVMVVVEKRREIYLHHNVRIHLDQVAALGDFLEFEAVMGPNDTAAGAQAMLDRLTRHFQIAESDLVSASYSDLLLVRGA